MVKQFQKGKIYVRKGSKQPYDEIIEAGVFNNKENNGQITKVLFLDTYEFDGISGLTQGRVYHTTGCLKPAASENPKQYKYIGTSGVDYKHITANHLIEEKPSYYDYENALKHIALAKPCEFRNAVEMSKHLRNVARKVLKYETV